MAIRKKRSLKVYEPKDFVADHPLVFYILTNTGSVIFVGRLANIDVLVHPIKDEL